MTTKPRFLKPGESKYSSDRSDVDPTSGSKFVYNPNHRQPLQQQRQRLPVHAVRDHLLYLLEHYQTVVVVGETGSGKSTQIPQYLIESGWGGDGVVAVTEPRRVACTSLAARVAEERDVMLGAEVGYTIRFDDTTTAGTTVIKYMTEAILVREMMADPLLRQYCVVMVDEVHERTLFTDVLLGLLKKILRRRRRDLHLIICSATVDAEHMTDFFNLNKTADETKNTTAVLAIQGRVYPVQVHYLKDPCPDYVKEAAATAARIHAKEPSGHVLVFLTGVEEVQECTRLLADYLAGAEAKKGLRAVVLPMHGSLTAWEQQRVFAAPTIAGARKIIVATNIAETSITIPGVVYVVDCGFVKLRVYGGAGGGGGALTEGLVVVTASKASAIQRAGRAGRTQAGKVYRLYPASAWEGLPAATPPAMVRAHLGPAVLCLHALGIENMLRFDFPSPPPARHLVAALEELVALGALDEQGRLTEETGRRMAELPLQPCLASMLLRADEFGCMQEAASLVALLQVQGVLTGTGQQARLAHANFQVEEGDLLTLLNVFTAWERRGRSKQWCRRHHVDHGALARAAEIRGRICALLQQWGLMSGDTQPGGRGADGTAVRRCITAGLFCNAAYLHHSGEYRSVRTNTPLAIHPSSVLYALRQPQWLVYCEVLHTSRAFMRDVTVIEELWLTELAPHFYKKSRILDE